MLPIFNQDPSLFAGTRGGEKIDEVFASDSEDDDNEEDSIFDKPLT